MMKKVLALGIVITLSGSSIYGGKNDPTKGITEEKAIKLQKDRGTLQAKLTPDISDDERETIEQQIRNMTWVLRNSTVIYPHTYSFTKLNQLTPPDNIQEKKEEQLPLLKEQKTKRKKRLRFCCFRK